MRKIYLLYFAIILSSCIGSNKLSMYRKIVEDGYIGMKYKFSDSGNRNIEISFKNDSVLTVLNRTNISQTYYLLSFHADYSYKQIDIRNIIITDMVTSDKKLTKNEYLKPYSNLQYMLDSNAVKYVFPDLKGDTLMFSSDFQKLQIKEFCFEYNPRK